ncbi:MAG: peptide chain release factor N(5)-glutamine methyltransferase [Pseudomonadota bacterium]
MPQNYELNVRQLTRLLSFDLASELEAELLICNVIGRERAWLYAHSDYQLSETEAQQLKKISGQRKAGMPIAYLLGTREFYGRNFIVNADVLIPRPETELLIEQALKLPLPDDAHVLDIGTGSGCIILTLAAERPEWRCTAIDLSQAALNVAQQNQARLGLHDQAVCWLQGDLFEPLRDANARFDLVVSNPPYVAEGDPHMKQGDVRFEPDVALTSGDDGLDLIQKLIKQAPDFLQPNGWLMIEHGFDQSKAVKKRLKKRGFADVKAIKDLAGIKRMVKARTSEGFLTESND